MNEVKLQGKINFVKQGETSKGSKYAFFSICLEEATKNNKKKLTFVSVATFEDVELKDGDLVVLEGKLEENKFTKKDGTEVKTLRVSAHKITVLNSNKNEEDNAITTTNDDEIAF